MWNLISIEAKNLCAFEYVHYCLKQGEATLVFGNNLDNDSQNSNGSGKSALIEAISIALTGDTLRKVNTDEIINDNYDECCVEAVLEQQGAGKRMTVTRHFPRKKTQSVEVVIAYDDVVEEVKQASVLDYNKFILEVLGLSKDDIFNNFILTAKKYKSFLSSSDREKKEIINRFSNGVLVDESLEALRLDIEPVQQALNDAEREVAENTGKVSAVSYEIEKAVKEGNERAASRKERIESWKRAIADKREKIREFRKKIGDANDDINQLEDVCKAISQLEGSDKNLADTCHEIATIFHDNGLAGIKDYGSEAEKRMEKLDGMRQKLESLTTILEESNKTLREATSAMDKAKEQYAAATSEIEAKDSLIKSKINSLMDEAKMLQNEENTLRVRQQDVVNDIASLQKRLAGVIVCPNCKHEFTIGGKLDIEAARNELASKRADDKSLQSRIEANRSDYDKTVKLGKEARKEEALIADIALQVETDLREAKKLLANAKSKHDQAYSDVSSLDRDIARYEKLMASQRENMFDEVFDYLDKAIDNSDKKIEGYEVEISNAEGAIKSYEESIAESENASETDIISSLKASKKKHATALKNSINKKEEAERELNTLKVQEANFIEFKTYLANIKVDAISEMTNEFLETIGSDIRVRLSGYTMLKSGKVRDKISVSLLRDGIDCGSFEKFSKGEQTRVELANILALHKLTNVNCEDGKGLNLLVFDEILDATDEQGLSNVFNAINETHITSLVVSHGLVAESYPNKLIINKRNGISFID